MKKYKKSLKVELTTDQRTVTGSGNLLKIRNSGEEEYLILVDYGINSSQSLFDEINSKVNFDVTKLKAVFLTHVHVDHLGKIPILYKNGYRGKMYLTKESNIFIEDILRDNLKIMLEEAKKKGISPKYTEEDIEKVLKNTEAIEYKKKNILKISEDLVIEYIFNRNNHILGSSSIYVRIKKGIENLSFLFSGDWNNKCNILKKKNHLMKEVLRSKNINLILESTYGSNINKIEKPNFETILLDEMKKGKKIFVAVNSLHKSSEVLSRIKDLQEQNENLFKDYLIYLDGKLTNKLNNLYMGILKRNFMPIGIKAIVDKNERMKAIQESKTIILSSSGMMTNGPIKKYLSEFIEDKNATFVICSYCAEGTVGRYLVESYANKEKNVELFGKKFELIATILQARNISSHGTGGEMIEEIIKKIPEKYVSAVLLNHGEDQVRQIFSKMIIHETGLSEEKIFLYDSRKKFIFNKNGLKKVIELSNNGVKKEMKDKKEKCETHRRVSHRRK